MRAALFLLSDMSLLHVIALGELVGCWILWTIAFIKPRKQAAGQQAVVKAPASKWGIALQTAGFFLAWAYGRPMGLQKPAGSIIASMVLAPASVALAWSAPTSSISAFVARLLDRVIIWSMRSRTGVRCPTNV